MQHQTEAPASPDCLNDRAPRIAPVADGVVRPKISIVTASFNALDPLKETIASVAKQSFQDVEHVIIDGASSDGTVPILEQLPSTVRWISEPDGGIADAMNKGVSLAQGQWIIVLHAGDTLESVESLETLSGLLLETAEIVTCGINYGSDGGYRPLVIPVPERRLDFKTILHQGAACRRDVFENIGGFDGSFRIAMDYEFFLRARRAGYRFFPTRLILSRMDDAGVSSRMDWPSLRLRFAEERRAQRVHCQSTPKQIIYAVYWPLYLIYRRIRSIMAGA